MRSAAPKPPPRGQLARALDARRSIANGSGRDDVPGFTAPLRLLRNKFGAVWLAGMAAAFLIFAVAALPSRPLAAFDTLVFDTYQRIKPRDWAGSDVVVVDIDEASIGAIGQWPWPRSTVAQMVARLRDLGAAAVAFDIIFAEPDRTSPLRALPRLREVGARVELPAKTDVLDNDRLLADTLRTTAVITGMRLSQAVDASPPTPKAGHAISGSVPPALERQGEKLGALRSLPMLEEAALGIGDLGYDPSVQTDGVVRRVRLVNLAGGTWHPSLAMEALRVVQGAGAFLMKSSDGSGELAAGEEPVLVAVRTGALEVPTDADGAIAIWHSPSAQKPVVPARALLHDGVEGFDAPRLSQEVANHIVLVGTSAEGLLDLRTTPLEPVVPGVTVHADILDQIIAGQIIARPDWAPGAERAAAIVAVLLLLLAMPFLPPFGDALAGLLIAGLVVAGCWLAFDRDGLLVSPVLPLAMLGAAFAAGTVADLLVTERQGRFVREAFGLYLAPALVERLARSPEDLKLGGEEKELTVLFCDIRGFTGLSEGLAPTELTELLNDFLTPMTTALLASGATIDKYMGDAIMAFWNAPLDTPDHRSRACRAVLTMRGELERLNRQAIRPVRIGIGLNTGPCCVGNLGSQQRFNYSAIGDAVNVASRVEGQTKGYGLDNLITGETAKGVTGLAMLEVDRLGVVGRLEPLTVHTVLGDGTMAANEAFATLAAHHGELLEAWRAGDAEEAAVALARAQRAADRASRQAGTPPLLALYAVYGERIETMRRDGVPADWDGVVRATNK